MTGAWHEHPTPETPPSRSKPAVATPPAGLALQGEHRRARALTPFRCKCPLAEPGGDPHRRAAGDLSRIGDPSLWLDEAYTWWFSRIGFTEMLNAAGERREPAAVLHPVMDRCGYAGTGEAALGGLSGIAELRGDH